MSYKQRLEACGIDWPTLSRPDLPFAPTIRVGDVLYVSGQIPEILDDIPSTGQVGREIDLEAAQKSARVCAANIIYWVDKALDGDLDRVVQLAKMNIFISAVPGFTDYSQVGNGASEVMRAVFGSRGEHARCALGMGGLPANVPVEIDAVFHVR
ncbi:RidA family protein [Mesorhizobium qingshengii]|uniref:Enamine deaminase RidA, house cleaning of reactive enamine intermediates, YjgF/YER057c/UK114 family n=1 Tax=Mesorhizobium qingshengii TaxID=1165689 RepID=A0A1G5Z9W6_9HYPH|nr:RidA family protein [Mesorhizobium qingshengii]SDA91621.1 Enamine deaminase RidA, house cleaning of reactive enamine intermediates, YjgF/YER057c/UK114 family [Mesorhizobium qingshengii]